MDARIYSFGHTYYDPKAFLYRFYPEMADCVFYVTDGNIMYLTDASRSLISCVIQHYAPVGGWGGGGTDA